MKKIIALSFFILSSSVFALSEILSTDITPIPFDVGSETRQSLVFPNETNWNDTRRYIQEEVDPCYDLSGNLLPGCNEKMLHEKSKRPRRSNDDAQDRLSPNSYRDNTTTLNEQSVNP